MAIPLATENLTKVYKGRTGKTALDELSIEVPEGTIFGFLGPNGAGKTTAIKLVLDFIRPTKGSTSVFGRPATDPSTRALIGYLPEQPYFHRFLKPLEVVSMHAALAGVKRREIKARAMRVLERVGIEEYAHTPIAKLSKGLTQRVGIAQALVGDPRLLILDEPTSGLDPIGRRQTRDLLIELRNEGKTIFLSSHLLGEVENTCDIVAILKHGRLVACGAPEQVRSGTAQFVIHTPVISDDTRDALKFLGVVAEQQASCSVLQVDPKSIYGVMRILEDAGLKIDKIETERESLEEAFLRLAA